MNAYIGIVAAVVLLMSGGGEPVNHQQSESHIAAPAYQVVAPPYKQELVEVISELRHQGGVSTIVHENKSYVVIGLGQRPTGGYGLQVNHLTQAADGTITIDVSEKKPSAKAYTTQVITYPTLVLEIPGTAPIKVNLNH